MSADTARYRLGFDIGGTFTDFVLADALEERIHLHKCLTTPDDPSVGALEGMAVMLKRIGVAMTEIGHIVHGTTLVTNAIIGRRGCKLGFLTTRGFRDVLEMGTEQRYDIHDLFLKFPSHSRRAGCGARSASASTGTEPSSSRSCGIRRWRKFERWWPKTRESNIPLLVVRHSSPIDR